MNDRWKGIERPYTKADVERLQGSVKIEHTLARLGAERLWRMVNEDDYVHALGAVTGNQAMQQVRAGLEAIYCSGWQVAADANVPGQMYPDQSLYAVNSVPELVRKIDLAELSDAMTGWLADPSTNLRAALGEWASEREIETD